MQPGYSKALDSPLYSVARFVSLRCGDLDPAAFRKGPVVLGYLIALRQVRIEVILARENRGFVYIQVQCQSGAAAHLPHPPIQNRKGSRQPQADRTGVGIGLVAEASRAPAEYLRIGLELRMYLKTYYWFILVSHSVI